jgi:hypothetical protein
MSKRFTETEKWSDPWFRQLGAITKLAYFHLLDRVDNAGVIDLDQELANFQIGIEVDWEKVRQELGDRVKVLASGKWHLTKFISFQFGELRPDCKPHAQVIRLSQMHKIKGYPKGKQTPQDTDKDKNKEKDTDKPEGGEGETVNKFDEFWSAYPRKEAKEKAKDAFKKVKEPLPVLLAAIDRAKLGLQWRDGVIPHAASWLNGKRWQDEISISPLLKPSNLPSAPSIHLDTDTFE